MLKDLPHLNLQELDKLPEAQLEEALLYLRYYYSRLKFGKEKEELAVYITAIETCLKNRRPGLGEMVA